MTTRSGAKILKTAFGRSLPTDFFTRVGTVACKRVPSGSTQPRGKHHTSQQEDHHRPRHLLPDPLTPGGRPIQAEAAARTAPRR